MKNTFSSFYKLVAVAACALTLGSCSRAEYAMLPKGGSYLGTTRVATPAPVSPAAATPETLAPENSAPAEAPSALPATAAATRSAKRPAATAPAPVAETKTAAPAATAAPTAIAAAPGTTHKLSVVQRLALNKVTQQANKLMQKATSTRHHDNTASTTIRRAGLDGNLRIGVILLLVGLIASLLNTFIGGAIAILGIIFIVIGLIG